jgi:hypothetical protein
MQLFDGTEIGAYQQSLVAAFCTPAASIVGMHSIPTQD